MLGYSLRGRVKASALHSCWLAFSFPSILHDDHHYLYYLWVGGKESIYLGRDMRFAVSMTILYVCVCVCPAARGFALLINHPEESGPMDRKFRTD